MKDLTRNQQMKYDATTVCCICKNKIRLVDPEQDDWRKVHDHDHVTGYFFGAAHNLCNKRRRVVFQIPCFIHNLRGYDSNFIVHGFTQFPDREIRVIGQSMEKYLQIEWGKNLVFRESLQHLSCSLERLVVLLLKVGEHKFKHLAQMTERMYGIMNVQEKNQAPYLKRRLSLWLCEKHGGPR